MAKNNKKILRIIYARENSFSIFFNNIAFEHNFFRYDY